MNYQEFASDAQKNRCAVVALIEDLDGCSGSSRPVNSGFGRLNKEANKTMSATHLCVTRVVIFGALLSTFACLPGRVPISKIPIPPTAEVAKLNGPEEVPIDLTQSDIRNALGEKYGKSQIEIYVLSAEMDWNKVTRFYTDSLNGSDWQAEPRFSRKKGYYQMTGWSRGGRFNQQALVIAYLEKPEGVGRNYLLVAVAPKEGS